MGKSNSVHYIALNSDTLYRLQNNELYLNGRLDIGLVAIFLKRVISEIKKNQLPSLAINLDELTEIDSAGVVALYKLKRELVVYGISSIDFKGGSESVKEKLDLFKPDATVADEKLRKESVFFKVGKETVDLITGYFVEFLILAANIFYWSFNDVFRPKARKRGDVVNQAIIIGANASLIVIFMAFTIGLVLALQSSYQLRTFGANIFIVDLVVLGMMSQMAPLITGILVAGRSGSAIAAEIASMKVSSEIDALQTMGLYPIRFVVVPKLYAALITMPVLIILANFAGIFGGAVSAYVYLDITPEIFVNRMADIMKNKDLMTGFVKSQVYASLIVLTGTFFGFKVEKGAEGVGKVTTTAVVVAISLVILADSTLGLIFY